MGPNDPMQPGAMPPPPPTGGPGVGATPPPPPPGGPSGPGPEKHHEDVMNALREIKDTLARISAKVGA